MGISWSTWSAPPLDDKADPKGAIGQVRERFREVRAAYLAKSPQAFNDASAAFLAAVREPGRNSALTPPSESSTSKSPITMGALPLRLDLHPDRLPVRACPHGFALEVSLPGCPSLAYGAGLVAMFVGFAMRIGISGRAPVTNMYESVIYVGLGVACLGLLLELIYRKRFTLAAASVVATLALILADNCPALLDPSLQPLQPVLRNNFWLVTHVMTITLSYAAFALALGIADITLGYYLFGSKNFERHRSAEPLHLPMLAGRVRPLGRRHGDRAPFGPTIPGAASGAGIPRKSGP